MGLLASLSWKRDQGQACFRTSVISFYCCFDSHGFLLNSQLKGEKLVSWELFPLWKKTWLDEEDNKDINVFSPCITQIFLLPGWSLYL